MKTDKHGFRLRGTEMTRIETFTDAAFAFALTMLVVSSDPITGFAEFGNVLRMVPVFLLSATMLMMFWWGHHEWSRRYGLDDGMTIILSCMLVFTMLVYVYPLRFVFGTFMYFIGILTGVDLGHPHFALADDQRHAINWLFAIYGAGFMAMSLVITLLTVHAWRQRDALELDERERLLTRMSITSWLIMAFVGLISVALALLVPPQWYGVPGWAYAMLGVIMPLYGRWARVRLRALSG
jgi:uncharacterized membrane protein